MQRRTKILATLGPATDDPKVMDKLIEAGVDVVRINFSHGSAEEHVERAERVRNRARAHGRQVGVLCDLQGPKIRVECFKDGKVELVEGGSFTLDAACGTHDGDETRVGIAYKQLPDDVSRGDTLLLDDGRVVLWVDNVEGARINCRVVVGGTLSDRKGINRQGGGLSAPALTEKDREDIRTAARMQADYLAVSFPRSAADVNEARVICFQAAGGKGQYRGQD
jgi:pyruvate kinase